MDMCPQVDNLDELDDWLDVLDIMAESPCSARKAIQAEVCNIEAVLEL